MTLVWGVRGVGDAAQCKRARWLFEELEHDECQVVLPAVALSEYLTPIPADRHDEVTAALSTRFQICPFDVRCAAVAARLWTEGRRVRAKGVPDGRKTLRADCLIVATAHCHQAEEFYSSDAQCRKLAERLGRWAVRDLPEIPPSLFEQ
jgi:predicted nucleic acid-binding protein